MRCARRASRESVFSHPRGPPLCLRSDAKALDGDRGGRRDGAPDLIVRKRGVAADRHRDRRAAVDGGDDNRWPDHPSQVTFSTRHLQKLTLTHWWRWVSLLVGGLRDDTTTVGRCARRGYSDKKRGTIQQGQFCRKL